jgi:hypothetical protein
MNLCRLFQASPDLALRWSPARGENVLEKSHSLLILQQLFCLQSTFTTYNENDNEKASSAEMFMTRGGLRDRGVERWTKEIISTRRPKSFLLR